MSDNDFRSDLAGERRLNMTELRDDIAEIRVIAMKLQSGQAEQLAEIAEQRAEIAALSREVAELRGFRNSVVLAVGSVLFGIVSFFVERTWFK